MRSFSLTQRMFLVAAVALMPAVVIVGSNVYRVHESKEREVHDEALRAAELAALEIERILSGTENVLRLLSAAPLVRRHDDAACTAFVERAVKLLPYLASIAIIDPAGKIWCVPDPQASGLYPGDRQYFIDAMASPDRVTGVFTVAGRPAETCCRWLGAMSMMVARLPVSLPPS